MWWNKKKEEQKESIEQKVGLNHLQEEVDREKKEQLEKEEAIRKAQKKQARADKKMRKLIEKDEKYIKFCINRLMDTIPNWTYETMILCKLFEKYKPTVPSQNNATRILIGSGSYMTVGAGSSPALSTKKI